MEGETEQPVVTGKAACARPFRHLDRDSLPVHWRFKKKAWMTSSVMEEWLYSFNGRMMREGRNVILFLDNATCHPRIDLSNVKLVFPPPPPLQHNFSYATYGSGCNLHTEILL
jgi:hypothetical protein